jgi:hypothetical protein
MAAIGAVMLPFSAMSGVQRAQSAGRPPPPLLSPAETP